MLEGLKRNQAEKAVLVKRLVANVNQDGAKANLIAKLSRTSLPQLRELALMLPAATHNNGSNGHIPQNRLPPVYVGAGGAMPPEPVNNADQLDEDGSDTVDMMNGPTLNYSEWAATSSDGMPLDDKFAKMVAKGGGIG